MTALPATLMSIVMVAAFLLFGFGARFARKPEHRKHGLLMILMAVILVANVLIWTL